LFEWAVYIVGGLAGALLANLLFGLYLSWSGTTVTHNVTIARIVFIVAMVFVFVILAHKFLTTMEILATSVLGGYMVVGGLDYLGLRLNWWNDVCLDPTHGILQNPTGSQSVVCYSLLGGWAVLTFIGMMFQCQCCWYRREGKEGENRKLNFDEESQPFMTSSRAGEL